MCRVETANLERLQSEMRRLEAEVAAKASELNLLRARFATYESALHGSAIAVYTHDGDLRYTSLNHALFGRAIEEILGRTDGELLPGKIGEPLIALKRAVLASGEAKRTEIAVEEAGAARWHDLHIQPLRDDKGAVIGLACAAVDVTERKEGEAHLRLLLRELTHRSKNLLAVIQAMSRQTGRHADSIEVFLDRFSARLQALAVSHDLLVRESWYGASLVELVRSHLAAFVDRVETRITLAGPAVALKPEAAQNLGLAVHELAVNAVKFGALSVPEGRIAVRWEYCDQEGGRMLALEWIESGGPAVKPREKHGFGSMVIERNLSRALEAKINLDFHPAGLRCLMVIPAGQMLTAR